MNMTYPIYEYDATDETITAAPDKHTRSGRTRKQSLSRTDPCRSLACIGLAGFLRDEWVNASVGESEGGKDTRSPGMDVD